MLIRAREINEHDGHGYENYQCTVHFELAPEGVIIAPVRVTKALTGSQEVKYSHRAACGISCR